LVFFFFFEGRLGGPQNSAQVECEVIFFFEAGGAIVGEFRLEKRVWIPAFVVHVGFENCA
jgi:hypothetical protein